LGVEIRCYPSYLKQLTWNLTHPVKGLFGLFCETVYFETRKIFNLGRVSPQATRVVFDQDSIPLNNTVPKVLVSSIPSPESRFEAHLLKIPLEQARKTLLRL
jgi:hypothetical protein